MRQIGLGIGIGMSLLLIGCTGSKCNPKTGESCRVLPETVGLSALTDPDAPSGTPSLPESLSLDVQLTSKAELMIRDQKSDIVSLLYLPFSVETTQQPGFLARLAGAKSYTFANPEKPEACQISQLGYSHIQVGNQSGVLELTSREDQAGPKPCVAFFKKVVAEGFEIQFTDVPVYADRPPVQIRITASPAPKAPKTAKRSRSRGRFSQPAD